MTFTVPGEPVGKARPRVVRNFGRVQTFTPHKTAEYEQHVRQAYLAAGGEHFGKQPIVMTFTFYFGVPKSDTKKLRQEKLEGKILPMKPPDLDNTIKSIADALNGIAYDDDSQIVVIHASKAYDENPRAIVEIDAL